MKNNDKMKTVGCKTKHPTAHTTPLTIRNCPYHDTSDSQLVALSKQFGFVAYNVLNIITQAVILGV